MLGTGRRAGGLLIIAIHPISRLPPPPSFISHFAKRNNRAFVSKLIESDGFQLPLHCSPNSTHYHRRWMVPLYSLYHIVHWDYTRLSLRRRECSQAIRHCMLHCSVSSSYINQQKSMTFDRPQVVKIKRCLPLPNAYWMCSKSPLRSVRLEVRK